MTIDPFSFLHPIEHWISVIDGIKVEEDRHITGIFSLETWERLMAESGFDVEVRPYPVYADDGEGYLLLGQLIGS